MNSILNCILDLTENGMFHFVQFLSKKEILLESYLIFCPPPPQKHVYFISIIGCSPFTEGLMIIENVFSAITFLGHKQSLNNAHAYVNWSFP